MPEAYLALPRGEQADILLALAPRLGRAPGVLEKDVWLCWVLEKLFTMPGRLPMVFKGGTSLSKAYGIIQRFSEDVDVTLDYRGYKTDFDPFVATATKAKQKAFGEKLKAHVAAHIRTIVAPHFEEAIAMVLGGDGHVEVDPEGEKLFLHYTTALSGAGGYIRDHVLVEFGGRNVTDPSEQHVITPDIAAEVPALAFPTATVAVLSSHRTFWEKATLIHVECNRGRLKAGAERLSRHWYDLALLAGGPLGEQAIADRDLLKDVIKHKKVFYNASYARYDECLAGGFRLVPDAENLAGLVADFQNMLAAGMFYEEPPVFDDLLEQLRTLERRINLPQRTD